MYKYKYVARISMDVIDDITDNIQKYDVGDIRRCVKDAKLHQLNGKGGLHWFEQVKRICNDELLRRKESEENGHY